MTVTLPAPSCRPITLTTCQAPVLCKMALALDVLSQSHDARAAFAAAGAADRLLSAISKHDKHAPVVGESIRALITLARYPWRTPVPSPTPLHAACARRSLATGPCCPRSPHTYLSR